MYHGDSLSHLREPFILELFLHSGWKDEPAVGTLESINVNHLSAFLS